MDNMKLGWDLPQEDELATQLLSGGCSPYIAICFLQPACWRRLLPLWTLQVRRAHRFNRARTRSAPPTVCVYTVVEALYPTPEPGPRLMRMSDGDGGRGVPVPP